MDDRTITVLVLLLAQLSVGFVLCLIGVQIGFKMGRETQGLKEPVILDPGPQPTAEVMNDPYEYDLHRGIPTGKDK